MNNQKTNLINVLLGILAAIDLSADYALAADEQGAVLLFRNSQLRPMEPFEERFASTPGLKIIARSPGNLAKMRTMTQNGAFSRDAWEDRTRNLLKRLGEGEISFSRPVTKETILETLQEASRHSCVPRFLETER
jgi:hypothetical protein